MVVSFSRKVTLKILAPVRDPEHGESDIQELPLAFSLFPFDIHLKRARIPQGWLELAIAKVDFESTLYVLDSF